ncbi:MAG TPA: PAS domain S-box protein [Pyrinomonadaceae bacterium]
MSCDQNSSKQNVVLVVDDTPDSHELVLTLLVQAGYRVLTAKDGRDGFSIARREHPDLVISDVAMPHVDGVTLCRMIRADPSLDTIPVLLVSAFRKDTPSVMLGLQAGADDYLEAPYDPLRLITKAARLMELHRAATLVKESEERFRLMADAAPVMLWMCGSDKLVSYVNKNWREFTGETLEESIGHSWTERIHPLEVRRCQQIYFEAFKAQHDFRLEYRTRRFDGEFRWILNTGVPRFMEGGRFAGYIGSCLDISDRRQFEEQIVQSNMALKGEVAERTAQVDAVNDDLQCEVAERRLTEQALRESNDRFEAFMNNTPALAFVKHLDGRYLYANALFERRIAKNWLGRSDFDIWPEDVAKCLRENDLSALSSGVASEFEEIVPGIDGLPVHWLAFSFPLTDTAGGRYLGGIAFDITERRRAERESIETEQRCSDLVENVRDIIYTHDLEGRFTSLNRAGEQITGYTRTEALSLTLEDVVMPSHLQEAKEKLARKLAGDSIAVHELDIRTKNGQVLTVEINGHPIYQNDVPIGMQGVARDVTERRQLEDQLRQAQKMESIGTLAGGIAHDFNNLLTIINGYTGLLLKELDDDHNVTEKLEEIRQAGARASSLTHQLLAFSRKQLLRPKTLDLNAIVHEISRMLQRLIGEDIELITILDPSPHRIQADPGQISQVIMNLAVNARDAMPQGGKLTIETTDAFLDEEYCRHHLGAKVGNYLMFSVSDTGCGMTAHTRRHLFEPFFTTKGTGQGTGLGLSTVYGIVKQSGGYIEVQSEIGCGSTFKVYLPLVDREDDTVPAEPEKLNGNLLRGSERVMLVEDEEAVRTLAKEILETCGYEVLEAQDGIEALSMQEISNGAIDLLLTDVVMPRMGGRELMDHLSQRHPHLRVLYMSGYTDDAILRHGLDTGTADLILKPFTPDCLASKVREVLDRPILA